MFLNKKIISSIVLLIVSSFLLAFSIFAWVALSDKSNLKEIIIPVGISEATLTFQMKKNDEIEYRNVRTFEQILEVIANSLPSDKYYFRLTIFNKSLIDETISVKLHQVTNKNTHVEYDMLDIFFLVNGDIVTTIRDSENNLITQKTNKVPNFSDDVIIKHDQILEKYRFNNILTNNSLFIISNLTIPVNHKVEIDFVISYDYKTEHIAYQAGSFEINAIYIFY